MDLYSLTAILRGGVRIQKNFNLCYLDTVDWSIIVKDVNENVINVRGGNREYYFISIVVVIFFFNNLRKKT